MSLRQSPVRGQGGLSLCALSRGGTEQKGAVHPPTLPPKHLLENAFGPRLEKAMTAER